MLPDKLPTEPSSFIMRHYKMYGESFRPGFAHQDALFRIVFDESPDAIFMLTPGQFSIIDCNAKAVQLFQAGDKSELTGRESFDLYDAEPVEFSKHTFIDTINRGMDYSQELAFKSLKGNVFWGQCFLRRVDSAKGSVIVFRVRRVVDYMKTAEMLALMVKQTAKVTGMEYFRSITELLAKSFGVTMAFIARVDEEGSVAKMIRCWHKTQGPECPSFKLENSPAGNVLHGYTTYYPNNLREMFPRDEMVKKLNLESFMGTPVFDDEGKVCGLLVMMDDKPMEEIPNSRYMLSIFASRVGAELERMKIEESYKQKILELQQAISKPVLVQV
jgi:PAS domain S-box-containing protein